MIDRFLTRIANARGFLAKLWVLARPYWFAQERQHGPRGGRRLHLQGGVDRARPCWRATIILSVLSSTSQSRSIPGTRASTMRCRRRTPTSSGSSSGVRRAGDAVHRRRRLSPLADAAPHHPLAALAERGLLPRLAGRPHLLPHGADARGCRQPRAAHRAGLLQFHQADAQPVAGADPAGDDAGDVRRGALGPFERLRAAHFRWRCRFRAT